MFLSRLARFCFSRPLPLMPLPCIRRVEDHLPPSVSLYYGARVGGVSLVTRGRKDGREKATILFPMTHNPLLGANEFCKNEGMKGLKLHFCIPITTSWRRCILLTLFLTSRFTEAKNHKGDLPVCERL